MSWIPSLRPTRLAAASSRRSRSANRQRRLTFEALDDRVLPGHLPADHIHPILRIEILGENVLIPADIGLTPTRTYHPHTHDATGILHIGEGTTVGIDPPGSAVRYTTLKDFFDVWRTTNVGTPRNNPNAFFSGNQILQHVADANHVVRMTVNGTPNFEYENYIPHDQDLVVISYVQLINTAPNAYPQSITTPFQTPVTVTLAGDDGDPDRDQSLFFRVQTLPAGGQLRDSQGSSVVPGATLPSPQVTYTPNAGFSGADTFSFVVQDDGGTAGGGQDTSTPATVSITVSPGQGIPAPVANEQAVNVRFNASRGVSLSGSSSDAALNQTLTFRIQSLPANGVLVQSNGNPVTANSDLATRHLIYTPHEDFSGSDSFTFVARDQGGTAGGRQDTSTPATVTLQVVNSMDPNDILGPEGIGDDHGVLPGEHLPFTIRFENYATATAPAQEILVQSPLDPALDWSTFRFGDMRFSFTDVDVPAELQEFQTTLDVVAYDGNPIQVQITARLDLQTGMASWLLQAIDPVWGGIPDDPLTGFLPPNDDNEHFFHGFTRGLHVIARVESLGLFYEHLADRAGHSHAVVGVDVDLADAVLDTALDLFHGNAERRTHLSAVLIDDVLQVLRHARRTVHHQVGVGKLLIDLFNPLHYQHFAGGLLAELVRAVAGADGDCQGIEMTGESVSCAASMID
jgi:hypothetical protein